MGGIAMLGLRRSTALCAVAFTLGACGPVTSTDQRGAAPDRPGATQQIASAPPGATAADFRVADTRTVAEYLEEPRYASADLRRGELLSLACQACHTLKAGEPDNIGPNLSGIFGRSAAARSSFAYSDALRGSGIVWTPAAVEAWLGDPAGFLPGTIMAFAGYRSGEDRRALVAFLLRATRENAP
jgi:cytochrome c